MKSINPIEIWQNGAIVQGTILNAYAISVTLGNNATFYYSIQSSDNQELANGNLIMDGEDYQNWDSDDYAWSWIANKLNLTII